MVALKITCQSNKATCSATHTLIIHATGSVCEAFLHTYEGKCPWEFYGSFMTNISVQHR